MGVNDGLTSCLLFVIFVLVAGARDAVSTMAASAVSDAGAPPAPCGAIRALVRFGRKLRDGWFFCHVQLWA